MTTTQAIRYERRRRRKIQEARAKQAAAEAILMLLAVILIFSLAACVCDGTSDADLIQQEVNQWAARGVDIFE